MKMYGVLEAWNADGFVASGARARVGLFSEKSTFA